MENNATPKTLVHGQQIRVPAFKYAQRIEVVTLRGLHEKEKYSPHLTWEEFEAREKANCIQSYTTYRPAWTHQDSAVLTANYPGKAELMAKKAEETAAAVAIAEGDHVIIEGVEYKVKITGQRYSDPVRFVPVTTPAG